MAFVTTETSARIDTYPFTAQVPFGNYFIESIKLALKGDYGTPVLQLLTASSQKCTIILAASSQILATVQYSGSLWMTFNTEYAFGFIKLRVRPSAVLNFSGSLPLHKLTYTEPVCNGGLTYVTANNKVSGIQDTLNITVTGVLQVTQAAASTGTIPEKYLKARPTIYIRRIDDDLYDLIQSPLATNSGAYIQTETGKYVQSVNGVNAKHLVLGSSDPRIKVTGPVMTDDDRVAVIFVESDKGFPTCSQWESDSK